MKSNTIDFKHKQVNPFFFSIIDDINKFNLITGFLTWFTIGLISFIVVLYMFVIWSYGRLSFTRANDNSSASSMALGSSAPNKRDTLDMDDRVYCKF